MPTAQAASPRACEPVRDNGTAVKAAAWPAPVWRGVEEGVGGNRAALSRAHAGGTGFVALSPLGGPEAGRDGIVCRGTAVFKPSNRVKRDKADECCTWNWPV